ncbi:type II secretion system minor pseudopilin GspK [Rheinheimera sp. WS51]|uniref:type II secretion system minor pseudopilin GspK n=1 Tax=Rheinheimera sp. WS51 TaxID=3425886 RepID=UPI003D8BF332
MNKLKANRKQTGVALISVLMIIAIVVVIAASMTSRLQLQIQRQQNIQQQTQAFWYAMAAEQFSRVLLARSLAGEKTVNLNQDWALQGAAFPVDNGTISGEIKDLRSCFNLNALQNNSGEANRATVEFNTAQKAFQRLLELKLPDLTMPAEYLTARIADWLDEDSLLMTSGSAEEDDYASLVYPYYTANTLMVSPSELRVILDITPADYQALAPYICVIPEDSRLLVNVNTLNEESAILLAALIPALTEEAAIEILKDRPEDGFTTIEEITASPQLADAEVPEDVKNMLVFTSEYFMLTATTAYLESGFVLTSVLRKNDNNKIKVLARRFGDHG